MGCLPFVENQKAIYVAILIVYICGKNAGIITSHNNCRNLMAFFAPFIPVIEMIGLEIMMLAYDDVACGQCLNHYLP